MLGSREYLLDGVSFASELPSWKINVCTAQGKEKHPKDYFRTNISHQKGLFKESYSISLIFYLEGCDYHPISVQCGTIEFLDPNVCWSDKEA